EGFAHVGAEEARPPLVEDEGDRAVTPSEGVGVGGLPSTAGAEDDVERGGHLGALTAQWPGGKLSAERGAGRRRHVGGPSQATGLPREDRRTVSFDWKNRISRPL